MKTQKKTTNHHFSYKDMKTILFPSTNRVHLARQRLLLDELGKSFNVFISEYEPHGADMAEKADGVSAFFLQELRDIKPDLLLARGDRFEVLPVVTIASYLGIPVAHIEGGDISGAIDGKVRHAISHLADYHFPTNEDAKNRLIAMGIPADRVWNFGCLDVEYALSVLQKRIKEGDYLFVTYHPIPGEDPEELERALSAFSPMEVVRVASNSDYGQRYGAESFSPEEYVNLMRYARCCVGNSSSFLKEASVLCVPVINVGDRQKGRLRTANVVDVPCVGSLIEGAISKQISTQYDPDLTYYQAGTAKHIAAKISEIL